QTAEGSTLGTAGFKRDNAKVTRINPSAEPAMIMMRRFFFFLATSGRGLSIVVRLGVKPVGRTIVFSAFASLFCMMFQGVNRILKLHRSRERNGRARGRRSRKRAQPSAQSRQ